jgi:hypothetical protein
MTIDYLIFIVLSAGYVAGVLAAIGGAVLVAWFVARLLREFLHW